MFSSSDDEYINYKRNGINEKKNKKYDHDGYTYTSSSSSSRTVGSSTFSIPIKQGPRGRPGPRGPKGNPGPKGCTGPTGERAPKNIICDDDGDTYVNTEINNTDNDYIEAQAKNGFVLLYNADDGIGGVPISGAGRRFMVDANKMSLRFGEVEGTQWDNLNIGESSLAFGKNTTAKGDYSYAAGVSENDSTILSTGIGSHTFGLVKTGNDGTSKIESGSPKSDANLTFGIANNNGQILSYGSSSLVYGTAENNGLIEIEEIENNQYVTFDSRYSNIVGGYADNGTIRSESIAGLAFGYSKDGSLIEVGKSGVNLISLAYIIQHGSTAFGSARFNGNIITHGVGSTAFGSASNTGFIQSGSVVFSLNIQDHGTLAYGMANNESRINSSSNGSTAYGVATENGSIFSSGDGSKAGGYANDNSTIRSSGVGSSIHGSVNDNSKIENKGEGAHISGKASNGGEILIGTNGDGAFATGSASDGRKIEVDGRGAHALGFADNIHGDLESTSDGTTALGVGARSDQWAMWSHSAGGFGGQTSSAQTQMFVLRGQYELANAQTNYLVTLNGNNLNCIIPTCTVWTVNFKVSVITYDINGCVGYIGADYCQVVFRDTDTPTDLDSTQLCANSSNGLTINTTKFNNPQIDGELDCVVNITSGEIINAKIAVTALITQVRNI